MKSPGRRPAKTGSTLSRDLSLFHLTTMGVGMMIGAGAVLGMGHSVRISGPGGPLLAFSLKGLIALETAGLMVDNSRGQILCLHVKRPKTPPFHVDDFLDSICSKTNLSRDLLESKMVESSNPVKAILRETSYSDLVIIGASREAYWRRVVLGTIPEKISK